MKLAICSDLHLEFKDIKIENTDDADVLILAGDIMIAQDLHDHPAGAANGVELGYRQIKAQRFREFLQRCSDNFPHVIYIAGNHEFYHGKWNASLDHLMEECSKFTNVYFLEDMIKQIDDVTFIGATLWTDCNREDPMTLHALRDLLNDYRIIRHDTQGYTRLRPAHTLSRHRRSVGYIQTVVEGKFDDKFVVVGHHAPSTVSIHPKYNSDHLMNGGYASDLSEFILDRPQIKLWIHGHTHTEFDYNIGSTRVVCNPRGYADYERDETTDPYFAKIVEV